MSTNKFSFQHRGKHKNLVLLPGWASDFRIYSNLDLDFNYIWVYDFSPFSFEKDFLRNNSIKKVSFLGWSMGGFTAASFCAGHPELVDRLIMVGIRRKYPQKDLDMVKHYLSINRKSFLQKFYTQCFPDKKQMSWFRENLLKDYCEKNDLDSLLEGLNYLAGTTIEPGLLKAVSRITIIHGQLDRIAPVNEASALGEDLPQAEFICMKGTGHIPFLRDDFQDCL